MATNKKPKKKYKPKTAPGFFQIPSVIRYGSKEELNLQMVPHDELEKLRTGDADEFTFNTLAFRLNWGYVMAGDLFPDVLDVMESGLAAVRSVRVRNEATQRWGAAGDEFFAIGDALNMTDEMQKKTTRKEQLDAIRKTMSVNEYKRKMQA